jgi:FkbM family methyltransferase
MMSDKIPGADLQPALAGDDDYKSESNGELRLLQTLLPFCQTVFDVGACGGEWTEAALEIKPELTVHCFEPQESCQQALVGRIGGRAILNCFAVGRASGEATIYSTDEDLQVTSTYRMPYLSKVAMREDTISILTLTDYCARYNVPHIDFLKIDVEGAEMDVLEGGIELFRQGRIMAAQVEYGATWTGSGRQLRDLFDLMAGMEYVIAKLLPEGCQIVDRYHPALDSFRYSNWLLLQREIAEVIAG